MKDKISRTPVNRQAAMLVRPAGQYERPINPVRRLPSDAEIAAAKARETIANAERLKKEAAEENRRVKERMTARINFVKNPAYMPSNYVETNKQSTKAAKRMLARKGYITCHELNHRLKLGFFRVTAILESLVDGGYLHPHDTGPRYRSTGKAEDEASQRTRKQATLSK